MGRLQIRGLLLGCTVCRNENFCRSNFGSKQKTKILNIAFSYRLYSIGKTQNIPESVCSFGNTTSDQWAPT